jgi:MFS family permease
MALSIAVMALASGFYSLLAVSLFAGIANGLSTGIVMTLGTDLAPGERRGEFLGLWRLLTDFGSAAGPLTIGLVVTVAPLGAACVTLAGLGALGSFTIYRYVAETLVRQAK